jgi:hypothetical protein
MEFIRSTLLHDRPPVGIGGSPFSSHFGGTRTTVCARLTARPRSKRGGWFHRTAPSAAKQLTIAGSLPRVPSSLGDRCLSRPQVHSKARLADIASADERNFLAGLAALEAVSIRSPAWWTLEPFIEQSAAGIFNQFREVPDHLPAPILSVLDGLSSVTPDAADLATIDFSQKTFEGIAPGSQVRYARSLLSDMIEIEKKHVVLAAVDARSVRKHE